MRMPAGSAPRSTSSTTRLTSVLVLPEPAGARTRAGPRACSTAARWASSSRAASGPLAGLRGDAGPAGAPSAGTATEGAPDGAAADDGEVGEGAARRRTDAPSRRPMSSRSSAAASPTPRPRGASTSAPNEKPRQNGSSRATSGWTKPSRTSAACAANSSTVPLQCQRPTGGSPPRRERRGSPGSSVHERRAANRAPGAAAAARCARSRRPGTSKNNSRGPAAAATGRAAACPWSDRLSVAARMGGPAGPACFARPATDASRPARVFRG